MKQSVKKRCPIDKKGGSMNRFQEKVVLVTGGTTGIGRAAVRLFAHEGAYVIFTGRREAPGIELENELRGQRAHAEYISSDVSSPEDLFTLTEHIGRKYGGLDIAFNNAGIDGEPGRILNCSLENWEHVLKINLSGLFYSMKYEIPLMMKKEKGSIINNISVSGHRGYPGAPAYIASKHGAAGLTKAAAMEYAHAGIRINGVSPGLIRTPMTDKDREKKEDYDAWVSRVEPLGRIGEAEEVAKAVLWLASDESSYITGHLLAVDGGILAK